LHTGFKRLGSNAPGALVCPRQADKRREVPGMPDGPWNEDPRQTSIDAFEQWLEAEKSAGERFGARNGQVVQGNDPVGYEDMYGTSAWIVPFLTVNARRNPETAGLAVSRVEQFRFVPIHSFFPFWRVCLQDEAGINPGLKQPRPPDGAGRPPLERTPCH
jgi:hypothetical protein